MKLKKKEKEKKALHIILTRVCYLGIRYTDILLLLIVVVVKTL